eukprot:6184936-Pleurochrysis_carterae.AAC.1
MLISLPYTGSQPVCFFAAAQLFSASASFRPSIQASELTTFAERWLTDWLGNLSNVPSATPPKHLSANFSPTNAIQSSMPVVSRKS